MSIDERQASDLMEENLQEFMSKERDNSISKEKG